MTKRNRLFFWLILVVAMILAACWLFHVPYQPDRIFSAIPSDVTVVSVQTNLAAQWEPLLRNPLLGDVLKAGGVQDADLAALTTNTVIREWARKLASDQSVIAFTPSLGARHKPALVFASWIGSRSRSLRWQTAWIKSRDFFPVTLDEGRLTFYRVRTSLDKSELHLSLALSEGLVLGCLSSDPAGVACLLETAEERPGRHSLASTGKPAQARHLLQRPSSQWGWLELGHTLIAYRVELTARQLSLYMTGQNSLPEAKPLAALPGLNGVQPLIVDKSDFLALLPLGWLQAMIPKEPSSLWLQSIREFTETNNTGADALAFAAVLDQQHNGRLRGPLGSTLRAFIKGVKTPTILIGLQVGSRREADARLRRLIDQLNRQYAFTLESRMEEGSKGITLIEEPGRNFYGSFEAGERIAATMVDDWLILASNASILKHVLETAGTPPTEGRTPDGAGPSALAHIQLNSLGQTLRNVAGILKLVTLFKGASNMEATRERLNQAGTWADVLQAFGEANVSMSTSGRFFHITIEVGREDRK
ncbi:MAG: hypothetical protein WCG36_01540 [bacterium]